MILILTKEGTSLQLRAVCGVRVCTASVWFRARGVSAPHPPSPALPSVGVHPAAQHPGSWLATMWPRRALLRVEVAVGDWGSRQVQAAPSHVPGAATPGTAVSSAGLFGPVVLRARPVTIFYPFKVAQVTAGLFQPPRINFKSYTSGGPGFQRGTYISSIFFNVFS